MRTDDSAILSVDFLAGFTIFLVALIFVINMIPGLLIGVQSSTVDYDAVAYRTAVILAEDPGSPYSPAWELKDNNYKDDIERLGLSVSSQTPNILSTQKISRFFENSPSFNFTPDEYREKTIFGDFPYSYNISLKDGSSQTLYAGSPVPKNKYGYLKRLVKVKHYSSADVSAGELNTTEAEIVNPGPGPFTYESGVSFILSYIDLFDRTISPAYRIDPQTEPVKITISNFSQTINTTRSDKVTLDKVRFFKDGVMVLLPYGNIDNSTYIFTVDDVQYNMTPSGLDMTDKSDIRFELKPTMMFSTQLTSQLSVAFNFTYTYEQNETNYPVQGTVPYSYGSPNITEPYLTDGVLEVCIW